MLETEEELLLQFVGNKQDYRQSIQKKQQGEPCEETSRLKQKEYEEQETQDEDLESLVVRLTRSHELSHSRPNTYLGRTRNLLCTGPGRALTILLALSVVAVTALIFANAQLNFINLSSLYQGRELDDNDLQAFYEFLKLS